MMVLFLKIWLFLTHWIRTERTSRLPEGSDSTEESPAFLESEETFAVLGVDRTRERAKEEIVPKEDRGFAALVVLSTLAVLGLALPPA